MPPHSRHAESPLPPMDDMGALYDEAAAFNARVDDSRELLEQYGVGDMAGERVMAHGREVSMLVGIAACDKARNSVLGTIDALKAAGVEDPVAITRGMRKALERQVTEAPKDVKPTGAEKKSS